MFRKHSRLALLSSWFKCLLQADLPAHLGVDLAHCEKQAQIYVDESSGSVQIIQGELMTTAYFDGVASETEELLQVPISCC